VIDEREVRGGRDAPSSCTGVASREYHRPSISESSRRARIPNGMSSSLDGTISPRSACANISRLARLLSLAQFLSLIKDETRRIEIYNRFQQG
jgi:hypothetical protein